MFRKSAVIACMVDGVSGPGLWIASALQVHPFFSACIRQLYSRLTRIDVVKRPVSYDSYVCA